MQSIANQQIRLDILVNLRWFGAAVILVGLATAGVAKKPPKYNSGAPLPAAEVYRPAIKGMIDGILRDPYSAVYEWGEPYKITCKKDLFNTEERWQGWAINIRVNAKNAYGGYAGPSDYYVMFMSDGINNEMELHAGFAAFEFKICRREHWELQNIAASPE